VKFRNVLTTFLFGFGFFFVPKTVLLFRQSDDTYKPLWYHAIAVIEKFNIRKKNSKPFRGRMHFSEPYVP